MDELVPELVEEKPLSRVENKRLQELEGVIEENFRGFIAVGSALAEIRERRLYRRSFKTFEEYCQSNWDVSRPRAYQLIDSSTVVKNLSTMVDKNGQDCLTATAVEISFDDTVNFPKNERQARELAKLAPEEQKEVWQQIVDQSQESEQPITAKSIKKAVRVFKGETVEKEIQKARKEVSENRTDFQSDAFTDAFNTFWQALRVEAESNWRYTSRKTAFQLVSSIQGVIAPVPSTSQKIMSCTMELSDREKLRKAGFRIFRMNVKKKIIEEWHHADSWPLYMECTTPKELHDQFALLMKDNSHLKG